MSGLSLPDRADVVAMLAAYGDRSPSAVTEELGSLEVTWLVAQVEQRYDVLLDIDDEVFAGMTTVTSALAALRTGISDARAARTTGAPGVDTAEVAGG